MELSGSFLFICSGDIYNGVPSLFLFWKYEKKFIFSAICDEYKIIDNKIADDLVFLSPKGKAIDDKNFQARIFRQVLNKLEIPPRVLYACRHTFGSRCIDGGLSPVMTAFLMGNSPEVALKSYTHQIQIPKTLPKI